MAMYSSTVLVQPYSGTMVLVISIERYAVINYQEVSWPQPSAARHRPSHDYVQPVHDLLEVPEGGERREQAQKAHVGVLQLKVPWMVHQARSPCQELIR